MDGYLIYCFAVPIVYLILEYWIDRNRIRQDLQTYQCKLVSLTRHYKPWIYRVLIKERQREYHIIYNNKMGQVSEAICQTEHFEGVFWTSGETPKAEIDVNTEFERQTLQTKIQRLRDLIQERHRLHQKRKLNLEEDIQQLETQLKRLRS